MTEPVKMSINSSYRGVSIKKIAAKGMTALPLKY